MRAACRAACAPPGGNEPNQGHFVTVLCLGVTRRRFANQSKNKGFRDKTCSSTSTIVGNEGAISNLNAVWLCVSEFVFTQLPRRLSDELGTATFQSQILSGLSRVVRSSLLALAEHRLWLPGAGSINLH